uniref:Uncharacterized protein n=1 Tax=Arundo donax TaxID=35708 RepID=A0A0A8XYV8_ARUDO
MQMLLPCVLHDLRAQRMTGEGRRGVLLPG